MANANYSVLSGIMDILKAQEVKKQQTILNQQNTNKQVEEKRQFDQQLKLHQAQFDQQIKRDDLATKAADAMRELEIAKQRSELANTLQKGGTVPGTTTQPVATSQTGGDFTPMNPGQATEMIHTLPIKDSNGQPVQVRLPTPETYYANQAHFDEILKKPQRDFELKKQAEDNAADLKKAQEQKDADYERAELTKQMDYVRTMQSKGFDDARETKRISAENERARLLRGSMERIANIRAKGNLAGQIDLTPTVQSIIDGETSIDEVNKMRLPNEDRVKLIGAVTGSGAKILTKDQIDQVGDFKQMVEAIKYMDQVIENQPKMYTKGFSHIAGALSTMNDAVTTPEQELAGRAPIIARGFAKDRGSLSNQDIARVQAGMFPSRFQPVQANVKKRNDYRNELEKTIDAKLSGMPEAQRNILKHKIGILDVGLLDNMGKNVKKDIVPAPKLSPEALKLIEKFGLSQ